MLRRNLYALIALGIAILLAAGVCLWAVTPNTDTNSNIFGELKAQSNDFVIPISQVIEVGKKYVVLFGHPAVEKPEAGVFILVRTPSNYLAQVTKANGEVLQWRFIDDSSDDHEWIVNTLVMQPNLFIEFEEPEIIVPKAS